MIGGRTIFNGFLLFLLTFTVMVVLFIFGILRFFSSTVYDQVEAELGESAVLVTNLLRYSERLGIVDYDRFCKRAGASGATRITIITVDGRVLGDSHAEVATLNNHSDRPEFIEAVREGRGSSIRHSASLGYRLMYYALSAEVGGDRMIIRTSRSVTDVDAAIAAALRTLLALSLVFILTALALTVRTGQWIRIPLRRLVTVAAALGAGDLDARAAVDRPAELATLSATLNTMAERLSRRMELIRSQRDEYQSVLTGMSEAVMVLDKDLRVRESNRAAERIFMRDSDWMRGRSLLEAVRNRRIQEFAERLRQTGEALRLEIALGTKEGGERITHLQIHGSSLAADSSGKRIVLVFSDITGIRQSEQIRRDFVSNVSHELKTPITSIKGFVETLQDGAAEDPALRERFLGIIGRQADGMHAIIEDLLQLSRLDDGRLGSAETVFDLQIAAYAAAERIRTAAAEKGVDFRIRSGEEELPIRGNPGLIEQALFNLLDNGVKYSRGGDTLELGLEAVGTQARITVADTGIGIPADDLPRIFERFYRVDKARSRETGGTGLGLAIVKHIVHVHGGRIDVQSEPDHGTSFNVRLPLCMEAEDE